MKSHLNVHIVWEVGAQRTTNVDRTLIGTLWVHTNSSENVHLHLQRLIPVMGECVFRIGPPLEGSHVQTKAPHRHHGQAHSKYCSPPPPLPSGAPPLGAPWLLQAPDYRRTACVILGSIIIIGVMALLAVYVIPDLPDIFLREPLLARALDDGFPSTDDNDELLSTDRTPGTGTPSTLLLLCRHPSPPARHAIRHLLMLALQQHRRCRCHAFSAWGCRQPTRSPSTRRWPNGGLRCLQRQICSNRKWSTRRLTPSHWRRLTRWSHYPVWLRLCKNC